MMDEVNTGGSAFPMPNSDVAVFKIRRTDFTLVCSLLLTEIARLKEIQTHVDSPERISQLVVAQAAPYSEQAKFIGFAALVECRRHVNIQVLVNREYRRQGLGRELMSRLEFSKPVSVFGSTEDEQGLFCSVIGDQEEGK